MLELVRRGALSSSLYSGANRLYKAYLLDCFHFVPAGIALQYELKDEGLVSCGFLFSRVREPDASMQ